MQTILKIFSLFPFHNIGVVQFDYDGIGRRAFRQEGSVVRYFYYDGDKIIAEREGNSWVVRYLHGLKPCGFVSNGQVRVYHADRLGSVRWVTDGSQSIVVSYVYEGFGKIVEQNGGGGGPYQFCGLWGYRNDQDAGLLHVGARYYEAETGRWVQKDKWMGDVFTPPTFYSLYNYVYSNPINFLDPLGTLGFPTVVMIWLARIVLVALITEMIAPIFGHHPEPQPHIEPPPIDLPKPPEEPRPGWPPPPGPGPMPPINLRPPRRWRPNPRIRVEKELELAVVV